ncbi:MAG: hypothetical protein ABRQ27_17475 [Clostridiaceae bacterium]
MGDIDKKEFPAVRKKLLKDNNNNFFLMKYTIEKTDGKGMETAN